MKFNYIDSLGNLNFLFFNGLFLKNFFNLNFLYQFLIYYNSFKRICSSVQKNRSFVNFSTRKLYRQKGTGKARAGSLSSIIRVKGARAFPNNFYLNYKIHFNKNSYKFSFFLIYSNLFYNNFFFLIEDIFFIDFKTKLFPFFFNFLKLKNFFFLTIKIEKNFFLSLNNIKYSILFYFFNFNPMFLLKFSKLLITRSCFEYFFND